MQSNANVVEMFIQDKPEEHKKDEPVQQDAERHTSRDENYSQKSEQIGNMSKMVDLNDGNMTEVRHIEEKGMSHITHGATRDVSFMKLDSRINKSNFDHTETQVDGEPHNNINEQSEQQSNYEGPFYVKDQYGNIL